MKQRKRREPPRRRSALATIVRQFGHGVRPSGKLYQRRPKHKNPRNPDGGFSLAAGFRLAVDFGMLAVNMEKRTCPN